MEVNIDALMCEKRSVTESLLSRSQRLMNNFETYIALIKVYCVTYIFFLPGLFAQAGYLLSPVMMLLSALFNFTCHAYLSKVAIATSTPRYEDLVRKYLGQTMQRVFEVFICLTQLSFVINIFAFSSQSLTTFANEKLGLSTEVGDFVPYLILLMSLGSYVKNFAIYSPVFTIGNFVLLIITILCFLQGLRQIYLDGFAPSAEAVKLDGLFPIISNSIYSFEGVGCILPVLSRTKFQRSFTRNLEHAIATVTVVYMLFGSICYAAFG